MGPMSKDTDENQDWSSSGDFETALPDHLRIGIVLIDDISDDALMTTDSHGMIIYSPAM